MAVDTTDVSSADESTPLVLSAEADIDDDPIDAVVREHASKHAVIDGGGGFLSAPTVLSASTTDSELRETISSTLREMRLLLNVAARR